MDAPTLLPKIAGIEVESVTATHRGIELRLVTTAPYVACPCCGRQTRRVHSRYNRTLTDLPCTQGVPGVAVRIALHSRKLVCDNKECQRRIFTEPLPQLVARYGRKTIGLHDALYLIGYALGGKAGARVALELGLIASPDTLLRRIRKVAQHHSGTVQGLRVVGIDDFAFRRGHRYGTILVDLERRSLVDLLPDRCAESVSTWLNSHPGIEIISRDRAAVYAEGATKGAPEARQVADRWHLLRNLGEAMERLTAQHSSAFRLAAQHSQQMPDSPPQPEVLVRKASPVEQRRLDRCEKREALYHQVKALREQGNSLTCIAAQTGVSLRTVQRFVGSEQFPARARRRKQACHTDKYDSYLRERIVSGCTNATQLYREIKAQGYTGCYASVHSCVSRIVKSPSGVYVRSPAPPRLEVPPSRTVAWWLQGHVCTTKPEVAAQQEAFLGALFERVPVLQEASALAQGFVTIVKRRSLDDLPSWLEKACQSSCKELRQFGQGLKQDLAAVKNAVSLCWSNGQTEGQVNRLKMVKRQMYGRAKFDLLRARVLPKVTAA